MKQNRNKIIDFYKGILMFGVIWGHSITALKGGIETPPIFIHVFLRTFDMPFFMILSGFFLKRSLLRDGNKKVFFNRVTMILFPIIIWNIAVLNRYFTSYYFLSAVFISSCICIAANYISDKIGKNQISIAIEIIAILSLYFIDLPWNLFYLLPFFVLGEHLPNIDFKLSRFTLFLFFFVLALCFWDGDYSPWKIGANAWKENQINIVIYLYRFALGIIGTYIMANLFKVAYKYNWWGKDIILKSGPQTLAIYILQSFIIERFLKSGMKYIVQNNDWQYNSYELNIMAYIIAPMITLATLKIASELTTRIQNNKYLHYSFGFKIIK